jgi:hypothetical protein
VRYAAEAYNGRGWLREPSGLQPGQPSDALALGPEGLLQASRQMQWALMRIVCITPGTTRNVSVTGSKRNDTPRPMWSG